MSLSITVSPRAEASLTILSLTILAEQAGSYSAAARMKLLAAVTDKMQLIEQHPEMYPVVLARPQIRRCVVLPHITLYYRVMPSAIEVLDVVDARRNPSSLGLT